MTTDHDNARLAEVGGRIRAQRDALGLNLHELARLSGISASALSTIETGKRDLRITSLFRIARALRIDARDLLKEQGGQQEQDQAPDRSGYDLGDYR